MPGGEEQQGESGDPTEGGAERAEDGSTSPGGESAAEPPAGAAAGPEDLEPGAGRAEGETEHGEEAAEGERDGGGEPSGEEPAGATADGSPPGEQDGNGTAAERAGAPTGALREGGSRPGTPSGGEWSREGQQKVDALRRQLSVVDGILHEEAEAIREQGAPGGGQETASTGASREGSVEPAGGTEGEGSGPTPQASLGSGTPGLRGGNRRPPDVGDGANDDVVAQQLRELAENETDPSLRDAYWCDYRKYKGLVKECDGSASGQ